MIIEGLGAGWNHDKMNPVRAPINFDHSILCPSSSPCFFIPIPHNTRDTATYTTRTSPNELSPIAPFTHRWEFRQLSTEVTDNIPIVLSHILPHHALRKTFSLKDFHFDIVFLKSCIKIPPPFSWIRTTQDWPFFVHDVVVHNFS